MDTPVRLRPVDSAPSQDPLRSCLLRTTGSVLAPRRIELKGANGQAMITPAAGWPWECEPRCPGRAAAFAFTDPHRERGRVTVAGRGIELRYTRGDSHDRLWQARLPSVVCSCGGDLWAPVGTACELLAVYRDQPDDEALCARCDDAVLVD